ncbi:MULTISPECIES: TolC family protein [Flammeovirga]|uniref:TolC family protein n=1 Tax=Flammeovirga agarivorans TaxID=2726742 RepID=A0A7X8SL60_9BACT|nr:MULTISPECIES: TolC family protein [Flammeovirga]NLR92153.1 TolC family protein [Flammeovirga agarivorans]
MRLIKILFVSVLIGSLTTSCLIRKDYTRTVEIDNDQLYRIQDEVDTVANFANIAWSEYFQDSLLRNYIQQGITNNFDVRIALENVKIAESLFKQGKMAQMPTINGNLGASYQKNSPNSAFGSVFPDQWNYDVTANITWEADIWGKLKATTELSKNNYLQQQEVKKAVISNLVSQIAFNYYRLIGFDKQKEILLKTITSREESLETTKALYGSGELTLVAVKQSEALLANSKLLLVEAEKQAQLSENVISFLMGIPGQEVQRDTTFHDRFDFKLDVGVPLQLLENRPDVKAAEYNLISAFERVNISKSNFYPSVSISLNGGLQSVEIQDWFNPQSFMFNILGQMTQPIWNKRQIKTDYEITQAEERKALLNFQQQILFAGQEVSNSVLVINKQNLIIENQLEVCDAYRFAVDYSQDLLSSGSANYLEVITARQNLLQAELVLVDNELIKITEYIKLYNALGGGWN